VASVASYFTWRWNRSRVVAASDRQARACSVQCDAIMPAFSRPPFRLPLRARVAELLAITLLVFASTDVALAQKKTVCTVTVNSADEKEAFRKALGPGQYDFVELVEHGRPDWLESACRRGVRCDVLVISGHYDGGNEFFSDRTEAREYLPVDELERVSCNGSCPGLFSQLKEVHLFGCNSLNPQANASVAGEVGRSLHACALRRVVAVLASRATPNLSLRDFANERASARRKR